MVLIDLLLAAVLFCIILVAPFIVKILIGKTRAWAITPFKGATAMVYKNSTAYHGTLIRYYGSSLVLNLNHAPRRAAHDGMSHDKGDSLSAITDNALFKDVQQNPSAWKDGKDVYITNYDVMYFVKMSLAELNELPHEGRS